jgi:predicted flavoprotein YhiN
VWEERLVKNANTAGKQLVRNFLPSASRGRLPASLAKALCDDVGLGSRTMATLSRKERGLLLGHLTAYRIPVQGSLGYRLAEVTGGGVPLEQLCPTTLASLEAPIPGLHCCGEIVDVFGRIGGFNFLWAWVSGRLAGLGAARKPQIR